jgi:multisubunit Na+/H+ antiporter MnhB subunit
MEKVFILSIVVTCLFVVIKILEMKFIDKEWKPLKIIIRDAVIVLVSSIVGSFLYFHMDGSLTDFLNVVTDNKSFNMSATQIFTDEPGF